MCLKNKIIMAALCAMIAGIGIFGTQGGVVRAENATGQTVTTTTSIEQLQLIVSSLMQQIQQLIQLIAQLKPQETCGNGICRFGETAATCAADCAKSTKCIEENQIGNRYDDKLGRSGCCPGLTAQNVQYDSGYPPVGEIKCVKSTNCGNGKCETGETAENCAKDCTTSTCAKEGESINTSGDKKCCPGLIADPGCTNCLADSWTCRKQETTCAGEGESRYRSNASLKDCCAGFNPVSYIGGGASSNGNAGAYLAQVCAKCGNGVCSKGETAENCAKDCGTVSDEGKANCAATGGTWAYSECLSDCGFAATKNERILGLDKQISCATVCKQGYKCVCSSGKFWGSREEGCITTTQTCNKQGAACSISKCSPATDGTEIMKCVGGSSCCDGLTCKADATGTGNGTCVTSTTCATEGKTTYFGNPVCCGDLKSISNCTSGGECPNNGSSVCAKCGNGTCGIGENAYNCPADCGPVACAKEGQSIPAPWTVVGAGAAIGTASPTVLPTSCCSGLTAYTNGANESVQNGACVRSQYTVMNTNYLCVKCGDGVCNSSAGENVCNCAKDCGAAPVCGDKVCNTGETSQTCPLDCGQATTCAASCKAKGYGYSYCSVYGGGGGISVGSGSSGSSQIAMCSKGGIYLGTTPDCNSTNIVDAAKACCCTSADMTCGKAGEIFYDSNKKCCDGLTLTLMPSTCSNTWGVACSSVNQYTCKAASAICGKYYSTTTTDAQKVECAKAGGSIMCSTALSNCSLPVNSYTSGTAATNCGGIAQTCTCQCPIPANTVTGTAAQSFNFASMTASLSQMLQQIKYLLDNKLVK